MSRIQQVIDNLSQTFQPQVSPTSQMGEYIPEQVEAPYTPNVQFEYPDWVLPIVMEATKGSDVPPEILLALLRQESGFQTGRDVVSSAGAQGIAQFMPGTAAEYGVDPWDPKSAIPGATRYLQKYYDIYKDWSKTLAAYNAGPGNVHRWQDIPETRNYVQSILGSVQTDAFAQQPQARGVNVQGPIYAAGPSSSPSPTGGGSYTVKSGDTLWGIAEKYYGSGSRWPELQGYSGDPRKLPIGQQIHY